MSTVIRQMPLAMLQSTSDFSPLTSRSSYCFSSTSTLRWRDEAELRATLGTAGFAVREIRDAPDRPGREFVVIARAV